MAKQENKTEKIEREYVIPLREKIRHVPIYKKTPKAVKTIKEFIVRHMKMYDRDLRSVKIDKFLNETLWMKGIKNPVHKIKVKAVKEGEVVTVYAVELPKNIDFKKKRQEKIEKEGEKKAKKKAAEIKEKEEAEKIASVEKQEEEKKEGSEEKKAAVVEAGKELEKAAAKQEKHLTKTGGKQMKHPQRMALQK